MVNVKPGLYVQTGNKKVYWARLNNYTHIEGTTMLQIEKTRQR